jgi:tetratricopeptide (TPR) repeat protein
MARAGDLEMAGRLYSDAAAMDPVFAEALEAQGEMLDMAGRSELAGAKYEAARGISAQVRQGPPDRPFAARQRGNFTSEILAYDSVLRSLKKHALPYIARGNAYLAAGRPELALADYDRALKLKPGLLDVSVVKAEALIMMGKYAEALSTIDAVLAARASDSEALSCRAVALVALGRVDDANADLNRQIALLPTSQAAARACVALRLAAYELALAELDVALARNPHDPYWRLYRATAQVRLGLPVDTGEGPTDLGPDAWPAPLIALHAGRMTEAEVLSRADNDNRHAEALFQFATLAVSRDKQAAERYWRQIVDLSSPSLIEFAAARNELARLGR